MSKLSELRDLYEGIGGQNAVWISTYQNAYGIRYYKLNGVKPLEPMEYVHEMVDQGYSVGNVQRIVDLERENLVDFEKKFKQVEQLIQNGASNPDDIDELLDELNENLDVIKESYIVLGSEYEQYGKRVDELRDKNF